ncbi:hypothetical protein L2E82_26653 [Cichorium intybus]|uniref:Uncharacterized protein n=1 Tax=Cichorium intybus TaxID=13427 RepID=A0ACB9CQT8_CICIN|nr:hypothetical protein L2E82_26653 [Cichorium intybus]
MISMLNRGDTILVFGVLHKVSHPFGYQMHIEDANIRAMEEDVIKKLDMYVKMLQRSEEDCKNKGVMIEVKITCGTPLKNVVLQEATTCNATWLVLDRYLSRDVRFYKGHVLCKLAVILDNLTIKPVKLDSTTYIDDTEVKVILYRSKPVSLSPPNDELSVISYPTSFTYSDNLEVPFKKVFSSSMHSFLSSGDSSLFIEKKQNNIVRKKSSNNLILCTVCGMTTNLYLKESMRFSYSEIYSATSCFSDENLLGEGGFGKVYKGQLNDGQIIAAKVLKAASTQGFAEFGSEIYVLSFARHSNIMILLGYCCMDNVNILVYEYICNKSLEWHLFDNERKVLEWKQRCFIAIGTAKGLRFLHEECRSSPIIHRDLRPSNILLTHDFVPMLGDFGLAKWKMNDGPMHTRILGTLGYVAPEYAENGVVSVKTDVYAYGIVLIQLITGRKAINASHDQSLREWALPLVERLALQDLVDPCLGDSYDLCELYKMAKTAYLCVKLDPDKRPSMGEVVQLLEGKTEHLHSMRDQFMPHFSN